MHPLRRAVPALMAVAGCAHGGGRLADYDFRDRTVAVVATLPPRPYVSTGGHYLTGGPGVYGRPASPVEAMLRLGAGIYKDVQADKLRERLDSAGSRLDVSDRISGTLLEGAARTLGSRAVDDARDADFQLEVRVDEYGVSAPHWDDQVRFRLKARLLLLDREGQEVWKARVDADEPVSARWFRVGTPGADVWTGHALGDLDVDEIVRAFQAMADHTAYALVDVLRHDMEEVRGR